MNPTRELILEKFNGLIDRGKQVLSNCDTSLTGEPVPKNEDYFSFRTQALSLVRRSCGEQSDHYRELQRLATESQSANSSSFLPHCLGVVQAAKDDFEFGLLFDLQRQISAEILEGFLTQAESRLDAGRPGAAALLASATLEEILKRLHHSNHESAPDSVDGDSLATLNIELAKAGVYNGHIEARITALAEIRRQAEAAPSEGPASEDVRAMISWLRSFAANHLR